MLFIHFCLDWVKEAWDKDFTDFDPLPIDVEECMMEADYYIQELKCARKTLHPWAQGHLEVNKGKILLKTIGTNSSQGQQK